MKNRLLVLMLFLAGPLMAQVETLQEGFESWPPQDWEEYLLGVVNQGWLQDFEGIAHSGTHSAHANINNDQCDHWLVTPAISVSNSAYLLKFWEYHRDADYYDKASVWISTGSGDPTDGDFVEVFETPQPISEEIWQERELDLSGYDQQTIYIAFRYEGTWHRWYLDDVTVGPDSYTDLGLNQILNPTGVGQDPGIESIELEIQNYGDTSIDQLQIDWWVNGMVQTPYSTNSLGLEPGGSMDLTIGSFNFNAPGLYQLEFEATVVDDFDSTNNEIAGTYTLSDPKDMAVTAIFPQGNHPVPGELEVSTRIYNAGDHPIDQAVLSWEVDGQMQTDVELTGLDLQPGEEQVVVLGSFDFGTGVSQINVTAAALGDINPENDSLASPLAVGTFFESFEGSQFPPQNWDVVFGIKETGFEIPQEGDYYYVAMPDSNFFGQITDTITSPRLNIQAGDTFSFMLKPSSFLLASHSVIAIDPFTGEQTLVEELQPAFDQWQEIVVDLSSVQGIKQIAVTSAVVDFPGLSYMDAFQSTASLHLFEHDLSIVEGSLPFMAKQGIPQDFVCRIKNEGSLPVNAADYSVRLMADGLVLAQVNGIDLDTWEESQVTISHTFNSLEVNRVYFEIAYGADEYLANNSYRSREVHVLPADVLLDEMAPKDIVSLAFPFNGNGNTNTLGEDDLTQSLYRAEAFENNGTIHGIVYHYDNLLEADYVQHLPLQLWATQIADPSMNSGFISSTEMVLLFDGTVEILPGNDHELFIPFDSPIAFTGLENLVISNYQYNPEWPPAIIRFYQSANPQGDNRSVVLLDAFEIDPADPGNIYSSLSDFPYVKFVLSPETSTSTISGMVSDAAGDPLQDALVTIDGTSLETQTAADGSYQLPAIPYGTYTFQAELFGYDTEIQQVNVNTPQTEVDFVLTEKPLVEIQGRVVGSNDISIPLIEVAIEMSGYVTDATISSNDGLFVFPDVFGNESYTLSFEVFGYLPLTLEVEVGSESIQLGDVVLQQQFLSAYDVRAQIEDEVLVSWKDPQLSSEVKTQADLDVISNSYTNEPFEEVWLGNLFEIDQPTTITSAELRTEVFDLALDFVSVDVIDLQTQAILASSEPFLMPAGETFQVDLPNIVVEQDVLIAVHWQNNPESTNALAIDYSSESVSNNAMIKYPGTAAQLFNEFTGNVDLNMAFLVRMNSLQDGPVNPNAIPLGYQVYRGLASEFPNISNWELLNSEPVTDTSLEDPTWWGNTDPDEEYRYAVVAIYPEGAAEETFSNTIQGGFLGTTTPTIGSSLSIYPVPARDWLYVVAQGTETLSKLRMVDMTGKIVFQKDEIPATGTQIQVDHLASGVYLVHVLVNNEDVVKKVVISH